MMTPAIISKKRLVPALTATVLLLTVLVTGCGDNGQSSGNAAALIAEGWNLFMSADYQSAVSKFDQAISAEPTNRDAYDGLGWSLTRLGDLQGAYNAFLHVLSYLVKPSRDTYAGQAIVTLALKEYSEAAANANWAIERFPTDYDFRYDPDVTSITLRLIRATARFHLAEYDAAYSDVVVLNDLLGLGLPKLTPSSPDFVAKLLRQIQTIRSASGGSLI
jgi:tetratricopeptide (TPR) repeat protein